MSRHGKYADDTDKIQVVCSTALKETLAELAKADDRTLSAYCKRHLEKIAAAERAKTNPATQPAPDLALLRDMQGQADAALATRKK